MSGEKYKKLKTNLSAGYIVCFIFLLGIIFRNEIPWQWVRRVLLFGFISGVIDVLFMQYKWFKLRKTAAKKE
ncbi:hypothetical protein [uncultured Lactobacillus sp.]|mgnify:CR=1 FL=1|uniref:hypothetical protein n=1 Tax=uncultured Lactobacillus sp. TaxID=153152 RepID=UPI0028055F64|nr:hypothetical protein [uncultured Lactobacillus sp.]